MSDHPFVKQGRDYLERALAVPPEDDVRGLCQVAHDFLSAGARETPEGPARDAVLALVEQARAKLAELGGA